MPAGLLDELFQRRVIVLTGKGGTGKSTTAAALALLASQRGKEVLLIEVDAKGNLPDYFDVPRVGFRARRLHRGINGLSMQSKDSMQEYLHLFLKLPGISLRPMEGFIEYVSGAIPGIKEVLVTGKIYWEQRLTRDGGEPRWDLIVVDGAPTGHVVSQLGAARHLTSLVRTGPIHDQALRIADLFADPDSTAVVLVAIPEEMPVSETIDLHQRFKRETDIRPVAVILNQVQPDRIGAERVEAMEMLLHGDERNRFLEQHADGEPLLFAARMTLDRRQRTKHATDLLQRSLKLPMLEVPYLYERRHGFAFTRALAALMESS